jgi:hypothetical protein
MYTGAHTRPMRRAVGATYRGSGAVTITSSADVSGGDGGAGACPHAHGGPHSTATHVPMRRTRTLSTLNLRLRSSLAEAGDQGATEMKKARPVTSAPCRGYSQVGFCDCFEIPIE